MELNIHPILPEERICMGGHSNRELNEKTGCIGYLTANLNASAPEFESSWRDRTPKLNTPEFTDDFNDMIDTLRQGMLKNPQELRKYCEAHPNSIMPNNFGSDKRYGFRIDTGRYSYMLVCCFRSTDCRLWLNAFSFLSLDRYMREARNGIPILDLRGREQFRMPNGGELQVISAKGLSRFWALRYFDKDFVVVVNEIREGAIHHIEELPGWAAKNGFRLLPLDPPMRNSRAPQRKGQER